MWFVYRKSPLGTVVKEYMKACLGIYSEQEAKKIVSMVTEINVSGKVKAVPLSEDFLKTLAQLDADLLDLIKNSNCKRDSCYAVIITWTDE